MNAADRYSHLAYPPAIDDLSIDGVAHCVNRLMEPDGAERPGPSGRGCAVMRITGAGRTFLRGCAR